MESSLYTAVKTNDLATVKTLLSPPSDLDINQRHYDHDLLKSSGTLLHSACSLNHVAMVKLLLGHRELQPNLRNSRGETPLWLAIQSGHVEILKLLLMDNRVDCNLTDQKGCSALWWAAFHGFLVPVQWMLLLRGQGLHVQSPARYGSQVLRASEVARLQDFPEVAQLLDDFVQDRSGTLKILRAALSSELRAAKLFALVVFVCDDYLRIPSEGSPRSRGDGEKTVVLEERARSLRFLRMVVRLPMELQMVVCCRASESMENGISAKDTEAGFRSIVQLL